jgi:predicted NAD/FAD-binding protein
MKVAVIGSGIAGMGAAYLLSKKFDVTVYEKNDYVGGHSNTVDAPRPDGGATPVDTGFIVYNERTYPNLIGLFDTLGVERIKTDMSFGVSMDRGRLEYGGSSLGALFAQHRNIVSPSYLRMVRDILKFYKRAPGLLAGGACEGMTLDDLLAREGYSEAFVRDHLLPMAAAIWSCPVETMGAFPAGSFIRFFDNHGLLQVSNRPRWWTVKGGSRTYVNRIRAALAQDVATNHGAVSVSRTDAGVTVRASDGSNALYDRVVFACHGDEAHALLADKTAREADILSKFGYQSNRAILHRDAAQMPRRRKVWSSWNYLSDRGARRADQKVAVTYWMNSLQSLDPSDPLFVTLNPIHDIDPSTIVAEFDYDHPVFDAEAVAAQGRLPDIQGNGGVWYCGSYCGYGFHEDGLGSAVAVAHAFGVEAPWGHHPVHAMRAVGLKQDAAVGLPEDAAVSAGAVA